ncbi:MAG: hypothetical protein WCW66_01100 [Patescibacteria group bacterium]|jgi:diadenosine tetraphosphate (Ap4A) HIT family hydrolase
MALIYESINYIVEAVEKPHVDRNDGGHIKIYPKVRIIDRQQLSPKLAIELMRLTMVVGEAMKIAMAKSGIKIMRVNYQDMGNWAFKKNEKPYFHIHIYGRAKNAKFQPFQEAVKLPDRASGFYDKFIPLNPVDIKGIRAEINRLIKENKYSESDWGIL